MHELMHVTGLQMRLEHLSDPVVSACEMLGYDPLYLACERRVVAMVAPEDADQALAAWQALPEGEGAAIVSSVVEDHQRVILVTELGGERILEELEDDPLPRIC